MRVPDNPQPGSSAVLPRSGRTSGMSAVPHQGMRLTNYVSPPSTSHVASKCSRPLTKVPSPPRTPCTEPLPSVAQSMKGPLPSSVSHMPPKTESQPYGTRTDHTYGLPIIVLQSHPFEQANQGTKTPLDPSRVQCCNHAFVSIEEVILMPTPLPALARSSAPSTITDTQLCTTATTTKHL